MTDDEIRDRNSRELEQYRRDCAYVAWAKFERRTRQLEIAVRRFADVIRVSVASSVAKLTATERAVYDSERERRYGCELDILAELEARRNWRGLDR